MKLVRACSLVWAFSGALFAQNLLNERPETTRLVPSIEGSVLYRTYCATCHGVDGRGAGPMAQELTVRVPDLTRIARHNRGTFPLERIERIISGEEDIGAAHGSREMPSREMPMWGPIFSQIEFDLDLGPVRIHNLAKYLEGMQE